MWVVFFLGYSGSAGNAQCQVRQVRKQSGVHASQIRKSMRARGSARCAECARRARWDKRARRTVRQARPVRQARQVRHPFQMQLRRWGRAANF